MTTGKDTIPATLLLTLLAFPILLQVLYTLGQVIHLATVVYKAGGMIPHLISLGQWGMVLYFCVALVIVLILVTVSKAYRGTGIARAANSLLALTLGCGFLLIVLIMLPPTDLVLRS